MGPHNRRLDLDWLEDFIALAYGGSFSKAAQARAIAQPAFSRHIQALEEWIGADLVDRSAHPAALTQAGERFLPLLEEVLAGLEAARIKARAANDQASAGFRFAATHLLSQEFFPRWFAALEQRLGQRPVQIHSDSLQGCEALMLQRSVQFLLCHTHPQVPGRLEDAQYPSKRIGQDRLVPLSIRDGAGRPRHSIGNPDGVPILGYHGASGLGRIVRSRLKSIVTGTEGFRTMFLAHHATVLKTMALEGRGVAWLPRSLVEQELRAGTLVEAGDDRWAIPLDIRLYRQRMGMNEHAEQLWQLVDGSTVQASEEPPRE